LALLLGAIYDGIAGRRTAQTFAYCSVVFQLAALTHNVLIWRTTAQLAGDVCRTFPALLQNEETVAVENLPGAHNGVFFLANGFPDCVLVNSGKEVHILSTNMHRSPDIRLRWDDAAQSFVRMNQNSSR
jgi:hypothetical protein